MNFKIPIKKFDDYKINVMVIGLFLMLSLIFNLNGSLWASVLHPIYHSFFVLCAVATLHLLSRKNLSLNFLDASVIALLVYTVFSRSLRLGYVWDSCNLMTVALGIYYLLLKSIEWKDGLWFYYKLVSCIGFALCLYALLQSWGIFESSNINWQITGNFSNPGPLGGYLSLMLPLAMLTVVRDLQVQKRRSAILHIMFITAIIAIIFLSESRAAIVASVAGIFISCTPFMKRNIRNKILCFFLCTLAVVIIIFFKDLNSITGRFLIWKISLNAFLDRPITGIGYNFFSRDYLLYQAAYFGSGQGSAQDILRAGHTDHAFNEILKFIVENGALGLIIFVILILMISRNVSKIKLNNFALISSAGFIFSFFVFAQFSYPLYFLPFKILVFNQVSIVSAHFENNVFDIKRNFVSAIVAILAMVILINETPAIKGSHYWREAHEMQFEDAVKAQQFFAKADNYLKGNGHFLYSYGSFLQDSDITLSTKLLERCTTSYTSIKVYEKLAFNYEKLNRIAEAEEMYHYSHNIVPSLLAPKEKLMDFYFRIGNDPLSKSWARKILASHVKIQTYETRRIRKRGKREFKI